MSGSGSEAVYVQGGVSVTLRRGLGIQQMDYQAAMRRIEFEAEMIIAQIRYATAMAYGLSITDSTGVSRKLDYAPIPVTIEQHVDGTLYVDCRMHICMDPDIGEKFIHFVLKKH